MCLRAGLLIGWDEQAKRALVTRANCDSWSCPECSLRMSEHWVLRAEIGTRNLLGRGEQIDFVTLTSHERLKTFVATEQIWRSAWSALYAAIKRRRPSGFDYFIVPEKHKDGRMHVHAIWDAAVSQRWLKDNARKHGLGYMAKIKPITEPFHAVRYVTKYVGKSLGDDIPKHFRRVRVSRDWANVPIPVTALDGLRWEYVGTNGALYTIYAECEAKGITLIDLKTMEYFDDVDLGTIIAV